MPSDDALLFIDTNKYLDLYRTDQGKKLLAPLGEQVDHIFVTQQVVSEVERNKISVAANFLGQKFKALKLQTFNVPDHLSGTSGEQGIEILRKLKEIGSNISSVNIEIDTLAFEIVQRISRSEDEVSKSLAPIFAKAVVHSTEELQRARIRKELGNPPGKPANSIGDQLSWEQILTHFKGKKRLWIISRDGDYGTVYGGKVFLNRFLFEELCSVVSDPEVYLFEDTVEGIQHFVNTTGVKAENRLSPEDAEEIEMEEKSLPPLFQPNEGLLRAIAEAEGMFRPREGLLRAVAEAEKLYQPSERLLRAIAEAEKLNVPNESLVQLAASMEKLNVPNEGLVQLAASMEKLNVPNEGLLRLAASMEKLNVPNEGLVRATNPAEKPPNYETEGHQQGKDEVSSISPLPKRSLG